MATGFDNPTFEDYFDNEEGDFDEETPLIDRTGNEYDSFADTSHNQLELEVPNHGQRPNWAREDSFRLV